MDIKEFLKNNPELAKRYEEKYKDIKPLTNRALIVGMGIGQLYVRVLTELGVDIETVDIDPEKNSTYNNVEEVEKEYDVALVCTPNHTHESIARSLANKSKCVLVEKPGVESPEKWEKLVADFPDTRFVMIKNNLWRENLSEMLNGAHNAKSIRLNWINKDRVPHPGSWFTNKSLSYGGVSVDLMPHLLSIYTALCLDWQNDTFTFEKKQRYQIADLTSSDYGEVNPDGVYDVDDYCQIVFKSGWTLTADWKSQNKDDRAIYFKNLDESETSIELGLCPESAYKSFIKNVLMSINDDMYWDHQYKVDMKIHQILKEMNK